MRGAVSAYESQESAGYDNLAESAIMAGNALAVDSTQAEVSVGIVRFSRNFARIPTTAVNRSFVEVHYNFIDGANTDNGGQGLPSNFSALVSTINARPVEYLTGYENATNGEYVCLGVGEASVECPLGAMTLSCPGTGVVSYTCSTLSLRPVCSLLNTR